MIPYQNLQFKTFWLTNPVYCILLKLIFEWDSQTSHKNNITSLQLPSSTQSAISLKNLLWAEIYSSYYFSSRH